MYAYCIINEYSGIIMGWIYDEYMVMWLPEMEYTIERLSISPLPMNISPSPMLVLWWITGHLCWWGGGGWGRRWTWAGSPSKAPSGCSWASCGTLYYIILYYIILYYIILFVYYNTWYERRQDVPERAAVHYIMSYNIFLYFYIIFTFYSYYGQACRHIILYGGMIW